MAYNLLQLTNALLSHGADVHYGLDECISATAMGVAIQEKNVAMVNHLISRGATINPVRKPNVTGLMSLVRLAVSDADNNTLVALLKAGADPNMQDAGGLSTPLMKAVGEMEGNNMPEATKMLSTLLEANTDPDGVDWLGLTPLTHALWLERFAARVYTVNKLLEHGADPDLPNAHGVMPLTLCIENEWTDTPAALRKARSETARALVDAGADVNTCGPGLPDSWPLLHALSRNDGLRYGDEANDYNKVCALYYGKVRELPPVEGPLSASGVRPAEPNITLADVPEEGWNNPVTPILLKAGAEVSQALLDRVIY